MPTLASSSENAPEIVLERLFSGLDGREPVLSPARDRMYRVHAQINVRFERGTYGGSGTLVGPRHLLTAGHNLFHSRNGGDGWAKSIDVRCALDGFSCPFGQQKVVRAYTYRKWIDGLKEDYDLALFVLDEPVGREIGWYGMAYLPNSLSTRLEGEFFIAGYPKEVSRTRFSGDETQAGREFRKMWRMSNRKEDGTIKPLEINPKKLRYDIDTSGGQSGSAIWYVQEEETPEKPYVVGIHAYGETEERSGNYGVRITKNKFNQLLQWISETYDAEAELVVSAAASGTSASAPAENIEDQYQKLEKLPSDRLEAKIARGEDLPTAYGVMAERLLYGRHNQNINKPRAFEYAQKAYKAGDILATFFLARMYEEGDVPEGRNLERYRELSCAYIEQLGELAKRKYAPRSQFYLAFMQIHRDGMLPYNIEEALRLFRMSAGNNYPSAQYFLGSILMQGPTEELPEITRNTEEGERYLKQAALSGFAPAELQYAQYIPSIRSINDFNFDQIKRQGVQEHFPEILPFLQESTKLMKSAARRGYTRAQYELANILERYFSSDVEKKQECIANYRLAAQQGLPEAIEALGRLGIEISEEGFRENVNIKGSDDEEKTE